MRELTTLTRVALGLLAMIIAAFAALTTGVLQPAKDQQLLFERAEQDARSCVQDAGHDYPEAGLPLGELQSGSARRSAYDACWTRVARDASYSSLHIPTPAAVMRKARSDGFRHWRCVEDSGFRRTTAIPLSAPDGYPLMPASRHFSVPDSQRQLGTFYRTVARCGNLQIGGFREADGKFADVSADGATCRRDRHDGDSHLHGCFSVDSYPEGL